MKKLFATLLLLVSTMSVMRAALDKVHVNPIRTETNLDSRVVNRLYKKGVLGLTKARTIDVIAGEAIAPGTPEAEKYNAILTMTITDASVMDFVGEMTGAVNELSSLLGGKGDLGKDRKPQYTGTISVKVDIVDARSGEILFNTTLAPKATDEDKDLALFLATDNFDYDMLDLTDDAYSISGEVVEAVEISSKMEVKKVRAQVGSIVGARKGQMFEVYKVVGGERISIGCAKCEQVLGYDDAILSVSGTKDGDKKLSEAIQNNDGSYTVEVESRSKSGLVHNNFQGLDKMFSKRERPDYLDPDYRIRKPVIAFLGVGSNDRSLSSEQVNLLQNVTLKALDGVSTITVRPTIYPSVEAAKNDGVEGLIDLTVDMVVRTTEERTDKDGRKSTVYRSKVYHSITGVDVAEDKWIDMQSRYESGSGKSVKEGDDSAIKAIGTNLRHFCEDIFPISAVITDAVKTKKESVKEARIDIGTELGVTKGMKFDIFEECKEGGADDRFLLGDGARFLLGEAVVKADGLAEDQAIVTIKAKNDGDEKIYRILQNASENVRIVVVSKASYGVLGALDSILGNK